MTGIFVEGLFHVSKFSWNLTVSVFWSPRRHTSHCHFT